MTDRRFTPLLALQVVIFTNTFSFGVVLPFMVFLVSGFGGDALVFGAIGAIYPFFQTISAPVLGRWSDQVGKSRVLLVSQAGTALSWLLFLGVFFLPSTPVFSLPLPIILMLGARAVDGITGGNVGVANACLGDLIPEAERTEAFGRLNVASNTGYVLGPAIAGVVAWAGGSLMIPVLLALLVSAGGVVMIRIGLPDICRARATGEAGTGLLNLFRRRGVRSLLGLTLLYFLAFNIFYTAFPVDAAGRLGWSAATLGLYFAFLSGVMVVVQGPVLKRAAERWSPRTLLIGGALVLAVGFALLWFGQTTTGISAAILFSLGNGLAWPSFLTLLSLSVGPDEQGAVQGAASGVGSFASIIGLLLGGVLYTAIGPSTFLFCTGIVLLTAGLFIAGRSPSEESVG